MERCLAIEKAKAFSGKWMELEITMLNAINQTLKDKHHVYMFSFVVTASMLHFTSIQGSIGHESRKVVEREEGNRTHTL